MRRFLFLFLPLLFPPPVTVFAQRPRAREAGIVIGSLPTGPLNAITDVAGVKVGQVTLTGGDTINTGVTAILPHGGNLFRDKVPGAVVVGNGFGKLMGALQVRELGEIESPVVLTCTLCVPRVADAVLTWLLGQDGNQDVRSINVVVGETNDGYVLNTAIRSRPVAAADVLRALNEAHDGPVDEGAVGAGRGTVAFGWKGGIGTSSRRLPPRWGGYTVGVLVQTNYGGELTIDGVRMWEPARVGAVARQGADGSCMIVIATDAPLDSRELERLASRAFLGLARTGSSESNGSGDFAIAFSTAESVRRHPLPAGQPSRQVEVLGNDWMSPLFQATVEATEEAVLNSLFKAETIHGAGGTVRALPLDSVLLVLRRHGAIPQ